VEFWTALGAIATAVTAIAVLFAMLQLRGARQQGHREFEALYVQRFWTISDSFTPNAQTSSPLNRLRRADIPSALAYLQLCEDEIDMRALGRVTDGTWGFWGPAIAAELRTKRYQAVLERVPDRFANVRRLLETGEDPLKWFGLRRWWSGL